MKTLQFTIDYPYFYAEVEKDNWIYYVHGVAEKDVLDYTISMNPHFRSRVKYTSFSSIAGAIPHVVRNIKCK